MEIHAITVTPLTGGSPSLWWRRGSNDRDETEETYPEFKRRMIVATMDRYRAKVYASDGSDSDVVFPDMKPISPATRTRITLEATPREAQVITHLVLHAEEWFPEWYVYRVMGTHTHTLSNNGKLKDSIEFDIALDTVATMTLQAEPSLDASIEGFWDRFVNPLGEPERPWRQPMAIAPDLSAKLPTLPQYVPFSSDPPRDVVFVKITGIDGSGQYKTYGCLCSANPLNWSEVVNTRARSDNSSPNKAFPTLLNIINDPQSVTPFNESSQIVDVSVSVRAPVKVYQSINEEYSTGFYMTLGSSTLIELGTHPLYDSLTMVIAEMNDSTFSISNEQTVPDTGEVPWRKFPLVDMDVRDMFGNVVGNMDPKWVLGYGDNVTDPKNVNVTGSVKLTGMKVRTSLTLTNIMTSLVFPDGSHIDWPEGHLPYNTNAYMDYLATMQQYDREMMSIATQKAKGQCIAASATALTNGIISGALTGSGVVGVAHAAVGVAGNVAQMEIDREAREQELRAKEAQIQLMPDSAYLGTGNVEYLDGAYMKALGAAVDMITVKLPTDAYQWVTETVGDPPVEETYRSWSRDYRSWFGRNGYNGGGRRAFLKQSTAFYQGDVKRVRLKDSVEVYFKCDRGDGDKRDFPQWLVDGMLKEFKNGIDLYSIAR